jgi:hypothetical protein
MLPPGTRFSKANLSRGKALNVIRELRSQRERRDSVSVGVATFKREFVMRHQLHFLAIVLSIMGASASAPTFAQGPGAQIGSTPGTGNVPPVGAPSTPTTGTGTGSTSVNPTHNQPGVPDTSTPGKFGTGASPSGLPGDDPAHPGFPARVGK